MRNIYLFLLLAMATITVAQEKRFVIYGKMNNDTLCYSQSTIKEVRLEKNINGEQMVVATAKVEDKMFTIEGIAPETPEIYTITGFDNGNISLFVEEGEIKVLLPKAAYPVASRIGGTPCNDTYQEYIDINNRCISEAKERMTLAMEDIPEEIKGDQEAELKYTSPIFYVNNLQFKVAIMDFIYRNLDSPVILYVIKYSMLPTFKTTVIEEFLRAIPQQLHTHKMYKELINEARAANLKEGNTAPDISGFTPERKEISLSDLKGKYILLDFWASWCAPCRREIPYLKEALAYSEKSDKFVVFSYSIDNKEKDWLNCIEKNQLTHNNWIHVSTLKGWNSEAMKLFGVKGVPFTALIAPDGTVVEFGLRGEAMVKKIKGIIDENK